MSEDHPVLYKYSLASYHVPKENTRNANLLFPKIRSSKSATVNIKQ
jgi:hypothetical protein